FLTIIFFLLFKEPVTLHKKPSQLERKNSANRPCSVTYNVNNDIIKYYPDIYTHSPPRTPSARHRTQKRVRFALQLESVLEEPAQIRSANSKNITKPCFREDGPFYGHYSEYIVKQNSTFTQTLPDIDIKPTVSPSPKPNYYILQSQKNNPEMTTVDSSTKTPRLVQKVPSLGKHGREDPLPSSLLQQPPVQRSTPSPIPSSSSPPSPAPPPRPQPPRQQHYPMNTTISQIAPPVRPQNRADYALPSFSTNRERVINQQRKSTPLISDYFLSNKLAEIVLQPQDNHTSELVEHWNQQCLAGKNPNGMKKTLTASQKPMLEMGGHVLNKYYMTTPTRSDILTQTVHTHR
ncbi:unnamed protein product, partial [Didymodactylos carnosus]